MLAESRHPLGTIMARLARDRAAPYRDSHGHLAHRDRGAAPVHELGAGHRQWLGCCRPGTPLRGVAHHPPSDGADVARIATREDETPATATVLVVGASTASLTGVVFALSLAGRETGTTRVALIGFAFLTVIVSWTVINTVFTLRYAHLHFRSTMDGIDFGTGADPSCPVTATSPMSRSRSA